MPAGSAAKASSVGAKTVNGPLPWSVSTRPAALAAASSVLKVPAPSAVATMSAIAASPLGLGLALGAGAVAAGVAAGWPAQPGSATSRRCSSTPRG